MPSSRRERSGELASQHARGKRSTIPQHAHTVREHRIRRTIALTLTAVVAFGVTGFVSAAAKLQGNITTVRDLTGLVAGSTQAPAANAADPNAGKAINILALGSDSRAGASNSAIGGTDAGQRSDTALIVHISADRSRIDVVSIPRDSLVNIPACHLDYNPSGKMSKPQKLAMFNSAFSTGAATGDMGLAAACTMSTVQTNTGIQIDDFALVDFSGFQQMVDAIGGVRVCVTTPLVDGRYTALNLQPGWHDLQGPEALDYVRARHVSGTDSSDLSRIERQKGFLGALVRKVTSSQVLSSPASITKFLDAATKSLTTSQNLGNVTNLVGLAWSLKGLTPGSVTFATTPNGPAPSDSNRVQWTSKAADLWKLIINDQPIATPAGATTTAPTTAPATAPPTAPTTKSTTKTTTKTPTATATTAAANPFDTQTGIDASASACG